VITWTAGPGDRRGDPFLDDLWEDQPWRDLAHEADLAQDEAEAYAAYLAQPSGRAERLVEVLRERWRSCDLITAAVEVALEAGPPAPPAPFCASPRRTYDDTELDTARRCRQLAEALEPLDAEGAAA
jgi:hypothetical protein